MQQDKLTALRHFELEIVHALGLCLNRLKHLDNRCEHLRFRLRAKHEYVLGLVSDFLVQARVYVFYLFRGERLLHLYCLADREVILDELRLEA